MYDFICKCKNKLKEISGYLTFRSGIDNIHLLLWSSNLSMDVIPPPPLPPAPMRKGLMCLTLLKVRITYQSKIKWSDWGEEKAFI